MNRNVEIKARLSRFTEVEQKAKVLAQSDPVVCRQRDVYFFVPNGRLKLRITDGQRGELIYYERALAREARESRYLRLPVEDIEQAERLLTMALGKRGEVVKQRQLHLIGQTRVHLDRVDQLGEFVELEVVLRPDQSLLEGKNIAEALMGQLGISNADLVETSYIDLL
ncbi:MAG: adenylate cyclase [Gemmatales bacterium]|nr:MAG: adenylate cyclase [Gemmatales bacterium]